MLCHPVIVLHDTSRRDRDKSTLSRNCHDVNEQRIVMEKLVRYEHSGAISTITLDDGKANVMSVPMMQALHAALDRAQSDKSVVLLTGRAGMFSGGFDLNVFKQEKSAQFDMLKAGADTVERLLSFPAPVVVACGGHAVAMGVFLMLACDIRIGVADEPFKICVNEVQIGMTVPRFAIEVCRQRLTPSHFNRAVITAEPYDHRGAAEAGFLDYVVPAPELMTAAQEKAVALSKLVRDAHVGTKNRVRAVTLTALRGAIAGDLEEWRKRFG
jgi:enoyl-CoA hydratase